MTASDASLRPPAGERPSVSRSDATVPCPSRRPRRAPARSSPASMTTQEPKQGEGGRAALARGGVTGWAIPGRICARPPQGAYLGGVQACSEPLHPAGTGVDQGGGAEARGGGGVASGIEGQTLPGKPHPGGAAQDEEPGGGLKSAAGSFQSLLPRRQVQGGQA